MTNRMPLVMNSSEHVSDDLMKDPYFGYDSLEEALNDCKATTQIEVFARLLNRENVFISGPAGSGKSSLIHPFRELLRQDFPDINVAIVAPTGAAANNIGGQTLHSWASIVTKDGEAQMWGTTHLKTVDVLVLDEVSMLPAHLFTLLDESLQKAKRNRKPFGGIQLVLMGDFMQLPPVNDRKNDCRFAVQTQSWKDAKIKLCYMDKLRRASDDRLQEILTAIAQDKVTDEIKKLVNSRIGEEHKDPQKAYVNLFTTNAKINEFNQEKLAQLSTREQLYNYSVQYLSTTEKTEKKVKAKIKQLDLSPLRLKIGCPVMLTKNIYTNTFTSSNHTLYSNGSIGEVVEFNQNNVKVKFNDGRVLPISYYTDEVTEERTSKIGDKKIKFDHAIASIQYIPLKLGYAISVHKSQGKTCDGVVANLGNIFAPGLGYVALSRVRSLDDLVITQIDDKAYKADPVSKKITYLTKKGSLKNRKEFIQKFSDTYEELLINSFARQTIWL